MKTQTCDGTRLVAAVQRQSRSSMTAELIDAAAAPPLEAKMPPGAPPSEKGVPPAQPARLRRGLWIAVAVVLGCAALAFGWIGPGLSHSETEDAFIEAHIVNVAPQGVSGRLCRFLVEENDRVEQGQVLAEIDPLLYRDKVELARSKVEEAQAELRRQESSLARVKAEVPIQIEIAKRTLAAAEADVARAKDALRLTTR